MQDHAADKLNIEMPLADRPLAGLPHGGECLHQDIVEGCAGGDLLFEILGARPQRVVGELLEVFLQSVDRSDARLIALDAPIVGGTEQFAGESADHAEVLNLCRDGNPIEVCGPCGAGLKYGVFRASTMRDAAPIGRTDGFSDT